MKQTLNLKQIIGTLGAGNVTEDFFEKIKNHEGFLSLVSNIFRCKNISFWDGSTQDKYKTCDIVFTVIQHIPQGSKFGFEVAYLGDHVRYFELRYESIAEDYYKVKQGCLDYSENHVELYKEVFKLNPLVEEDIIMSKKHLKESEDGLLEKRRIIEDELFQKRMISEKTDKGVYLNVYVCSVETESGDMYIDVYDYDKGNLTEENRIQEIKKDCADSFNRLNCDQVWEDDVNVSSETLFLSRKTLDMLSKI